MRRVVRWVGLLFGLLAVILVVGSITVYFLSNSRIAKTYELSDENLMLDLSNASVKRGRHLVKAVGKCVECHDKDLGGNVLFEDPAFGRFVAPNLTTGRGGIGEVNTTVLVQTIRYGLNRHDNRSVILMPSQTFFFLSDRDLADIIAYLKAVPAVDRELPEIKIGPLARFLLVRNALPTLLPAETIDKTAARPEPEPDVSKEYGEYLATVGGCRDCHKEDLSGGGMPGTPPGTPAAADLRIDSPFGKWSESDFIKAMRYGIRPDKSEINTFMPWKFIRDMTDKELQALWVYLRGSEITN